MVISMTKIISHRGANKFAPQNTIPAFLKALEFNVDGFENDVHLTKDGVLVVCHDYTIDATSDGTGEVSEYTFDEIRKFDFGSYFSEEFKGTKIPSLDDFLDIARGVEVINIELKSPKQKNSGIVRKTIDKVKEFGLLDQLLISSFDPSLLVEVKEINKAVKTGFLYSPDSGFLEEDKFDDIFSYVEEINADALHPMILFVDDDYLEQAHDQGLIVNPWTVNQEFAMKMLADYNCDGIITDLPDVAAKVIRGE